MVYSTYHMECINKMSFKKIVLPTVVKKKPFYGVSISTELHSIDQIVKNIHWLFNKYNDFHIIIGDSLTRHNLTTATGSDQAAYDLSIQLGQEWSYAIQKALSIYSEIHEISIPIQILHWDKWLKTESFTIYENKIYAAYKYSKAFKLFVDNIVSDFILRNINRGLSLERESCLKYILEEFAVLLLWANTECSLLIYRTNVKMVLPLMQFFSVEKLPVLNLKRHAQHINHNSEAQEQYA